MLPTDSSPQGKPRPGHPSILIASPATLDAALKLALIRAEIARVASETVSPYDRATASPSTPDVHHLRSTPRFCLTFTG